MANTKKSWREVFIENYNGTSEVAKEIEPFIKENYKGNAYIPWATMERLVYMCDENASFENIRNDNGGLVHTDMVAVYQQNIQKGEVVSETKSQMFSHMVKVKLIFMGKEFIEEYPIQDQDYSAAKIFNQNLVNRALQRAKAKVASRATGLGFKLYEGKDLQVDEVPQETKPQLPVENVENNKKAVKNEEKVPVNVKKSSKNDENAQKTEKIVQNVEEQTIVEEKPVEVKPVQVSGKENNVISEIVHLIKNTEVAKMNLALQKVNISLMKKHKIALSTELSEEALTELLSREDIFKSPEQLLKTLNMLVSA